MLRACGTGAAYRGTKVRAMRVSYGSDRACYRPVKPGNDSKGTHR